MSASRYLLALSRDKLLPERLSRINPKFGTPHIAIIITGLVIFLSLLLPLKMLAESASVVLILTFIMSCLSVIILRQSKVHNYRPLFHAPLYPWIQIAGIVGYGFVLASMQAKSFLISGGLIAAGILIYWFYGRKFAKQEYALLHMIERITDKQLVSGSLEKELKDIIRERDQVVLDRVDCLIEDSLVLDIEQHIKVDDFFEIVAEKLAPRLDINKDQLAEKLKLREKQSSTLLDDSLAVPHVVIEGEKKFQLLLARAKEGVEFADDARNVNAVFVVIGTTDERNFHLRILSAIAQVFQNKDFEELWMSATNEQGLRDTILLSERKRGARAQCALP
jgi:basic amino acid/polyamine antiporter, APA family